MIQDGRATMNRGARLYAKGKARYRRHKSTPSEAKQGLKMMHDGFKMAKDDGASLVKNGVAVNNQIAQDKGFGVEFVQGNQLIQTGFQSMEDAAKLFLQGESIYLKIK